MKISTKGRYALEAVVDLAVNSTDHLQSLQQIAERLDLSKNYLEQLFGTLRKKGIVNSIRGAQGGYLLARAPEAITAGEVIRAVEGPLSPVVCLDDGKCQQACTDFEMCVTRIVWQAIMDEINQVADEVTLQDLVSDYLESRDASDGETDIEYMI
ncbi:RrF2 family transcriptional regulator [Anaerotalea alkaliphila]|uniref:Rrf2 family transcriptional regulator n=1 Tax=Anaerotalea alkaliphila TaxID=2662126 RepID=A0A7X5HY43_9FIRM|nr:Rrf2 family transcriptional regulator [Anaerotalea alkaliphila]NDL68760.1 Rrf2 family transcriptional regulator [Anaerotalea alkaliphila]